MKDFESASDDLIANIDEMNKQVRKKIASGEKLSGIEKKSLKNQEKFKSREGQNYPAVISSGSAPAETGEQKKIVKSMQEVATRVGDLADHNSAEIGNFVSSLGPLGFLAVKSAKVIGGARDLLFGNKAERRAKKDAKINKSKLSQEASDEAKREKLVNKKLKANPYPVNDKRVELVLKKLLGGDENSAKLLQHMDEQNEANAREEFELMKSQEEEQKKTEEQLKKMGGGGSAEKKKMGADKMFTLIALGIVAIAALAAIIGPKIKQFVDDVSKFLKPLTDLVNKITGNNPEAQAKKSADNAETQRLIEARLSENRAKMEAEFSVLGKGISEEYRAKIKEDAKSWGGLSVDEVRKRTKEAEAKFDKATQKISDMSDSTATQLATTRFKQGLDEKGRQVIDPEATAAAKKTYSEFIKKELESIAAQRKEFQNSIMSGMTLTNPDGTPLTVNVEGLNDKGKGSGKSAPATMINLNSMLDKSYSKGP